MIKVPKLILEVSMTMQPTKIIRVLDDLASTRVILPRVIIEQLDNNGMSYLGIPGRIAIDETRDEGLINVVNNLTCYTPQMARISLQHIELFMLSDRERELIVMCAEHSLYINKLVFPLATN
jgi:hypothetical protein